MSDRGEAGRALVFATRNEGKVAELSELLAGTGWSIERLPSTIGEYEETGDTFTENARGKALFAVAQLGLPPGKRSLPVLADDSGLEIDALGGEPGVRSARYLDEDMSQDQRNLAVLELLADTPAEQRSARFVCHLVLADDGGIVHETTGTCDGVIGRSPRGDGGFGYDPIFVLPDLGMTFAEISREDKSVRSHRGAATRDMVEFLRDWAPT